MYLKALEIVGFKSFAETTKLEFLPGMTAIVGPNGCGKSNIADAIRWVLGEQSAKAMRASKMEDCIFNGTDTRKPLGMAEVSITFSDCEQALGMEYNEVTITRRVFRSGEGQYYLNKTACRLKDIQRLFLGTGIGTTSYSLMEQGQIDRVLSSHPEDRRTIFEEASGITKFKADKKEAIRKLEYTEANLLRLADVIREVKRQIGSLQRQAGKARRYKELRDELRKHDVYVTKSKLTAMDAEIARLQSETKALNEQIQLSRSEITEMEQGNALLRKSILQTEHEIGAIMEKGMEARSKLDHTHEMIRVNQRQIEEYITLSRRDSEELVKLKQQLEDQRQTLVEFATRIDKARAGQANAEQELKQANDALAAHQQQVESKRRGIHDLRTESIEAESQTSKLQNQLTLLESQEHSDAIRRERLFAEQTQLESVVKRYGKRQDEMKAVLESSALEVTSAVVALEKAQVQLSENRSLAAKTRETLSDLRSQSSGRKARLELLDKDEREDGSLPGGSRLLLDKSNPLNIPQDRIMGLLLSHITVENEYRIAMESALRSWLDAVVVTDTDSAVQILRGLENRRSGSARILVMPAGDQTAPTCEIQNGNRLMDHIKASETVLPVLNRILASVFVIDDLNSLPSPIPSSIVYVTKKGSLLSGKGCAEFCMTEAGVGSLVNRRSIVADLKKELSSLEQEITGLEQNLSGFTGQESEIQDSTEKARTTLQDKRHIASLKEGEYQIVSSEADQAKDRLNTVTWELNSLSSSKDSAPSIRNSIAANIESLRARREKIIKDIEAQTRNLLELENTHTDIQSHVTEKSIYFAHVRQESEHLAIQHDSAQKRIADVETQLHNRAEGISSYEKNIEHLKEAIRNGESQLTSLREAVETNTSRAENLRRNLDKQAKELENLEVILSEKKSVIEDIRSNCSGLNIKLTETTMRRQNQIERITQEYSITESQLMEQPEPVGEGEQQTMESMETLIAELRTKIEAMGPVNLVAIEEYQELEERHTFLTQQEQDLVNSKQQLMEMIKKINKTTSEMFSATFAAVNENFQTMFKRLFNGGSAKLVLVNEEDVLECGIEIIARPPGKRLQNITLLSGGERTLTAVALLFAIYMIKPSPFCLLDELDAPLDESNIGRFVSVLQGFLEQSQFVVITHNRQTIAAGSVLYGITMPEKGVSKIVSMRFNDQKKRTFDAPTPMEPVQTT